jgi:hypothetical protein
VSKVQAPQPATDLQRVQQAAAEVTPVWRCMSWPQQSTLGIGEQMSCGEPGGAAGGAAIGRSCHSSPSTEQVHFTLGAAAATRLPPMLHSTTRLIIRQLVPLPGSVSDVAAAPRGAPGARNLRNDDAAKDQSSAEV